MLYHPDVFEPLVDEPWDERRVREAIRAIVADADMAFEADGLWPGHEWDVWQTQPPLKMVYVGAAGVIWALDALRRRGQAETATDLAAAIARTLELWCAGPDDFGGELPLPEPPESSLLCGESGILVVAWRLAPSDDLADTLLGRVRENVANEADELLWGSPGTLLAAHAMHGWTGEERWAEAWRESAEALGSRRDADGLWTQRIYGLEPTRMLGPAHGLVGNVHALLQGDDEIFARETADLLADEAILEDGLANWPPVAGEGLENARGEIRVQWCHGAPGIVTTAAPYLDEELLLAGAELTWQAGAHGAEKGSGICHGTAGNGYALLKAFERTGDERWLERARRFAVHALAQAERAREANGLGRYALFTGDVGVALFAADCLDGTARFPVLDGWD